ncbi:unnamed protein product [Withania somnifera]
MNKPCSVLCHQKQIAFSLLKSPYKISTLNHLKSLHVSNRIMHLNIPFINFDQMLLNNVQPDRFTYPFAICACLDLMEFVKEVGLQGQLFKIGVNLDVFVCSSLVDFYTAMGDLDMTMKVFEEMPVKDEVTWYAMLSSYVNKFNDMDKAQDLFEKIPCKDVIWHTMILGCVKAGELELAKEYFDRAPNGEIEYLLRLFYEMPCRDLVSWNTVVGELVRDGRISEAMRFFHEMQRVNISPNDVTLASLLSACAQTGALDTGKWLHSYIDRRFSELNAVIGTALVDMYCKCGDLESAAGVFNKMSERDVVAWSAMILGSSIIGQSRTALNFFYSMKDESERPNDATILGLEYYGCMVDLLGRAGLLDEAYNLLQSMPYESHIGAWGALLEHLIQLDLEDGGYLAILSNIYANAGRWEDVSKVRKLMKEKGIGKSRGISSIEVNGLIHESGMKFIDDSRGQAGHVASTREVFFNVEEEEKEKELLCEKMAVAFELIATDKTTIIRVVKNLRICPDCHAAMKLISASSLGTAIVFTTSRMVFALVETIGE